MPAPKPLATLLTNPRFTRCQTPLSASEFAAQIAAIDRAEQKALAAERKSLALAEAERIFMRSAIPLRYEAADLSKPYPQQVEAFEFGRRYVEGFRRRIRDGRGLLVHGSGTMDFPADVGTGKSWLLCAIGNALLAQGVAVTYCTAIEAVQRVKATFSRESKESEWDIVTVLCRPDVLLVDELGVQGDTTFERRVLEQVMDGRQRMCRPTLFATNLSPDAVRGLVGIRVYDRMREGWFLPMCGASLRGLATDKRGCHE